MRDLTWLVRQIPLIFFSYFLAKESEIFIFLGSFSSLLVQSFFNFQSRVFFCFVNIIRHDQRQNTVSIPSIVVTPSTIVIRMKGFDKYSQTQRAEDTLPGRIQAAPLSWLNFVTSHSLWEALKIKSSKTNRCVIIVNDYQSWAGKLQFFSYTI